MNKQTKIIIGVTLAMVLITMISMMLSKKDAPKNEEPSTEETSSNEKATTEKAIDFEDKTSTEAPVTTESTAETTTEAPDPDMGVKYGGRTGLNKEDWNEADTRTTQSEDDIKKLIKDYTDLRNETLIGNAKDVDARFEALTTDHFRSAYFPDGFKNVEDSGLVSVKENHFDVSFPQNFTFKEQAITAEASFEYIFTRKNGTPYLFPYSFTLYKLKMEDGIYKIDGLNI